MRSLGGAQQALPEKVALDPNCFHRGRTWEKLFQPRWNRACWVWETLGRAKLKPEAPKEGREVAWERQISGTAQEGLMGLAYTWWSHL